MVRQEAVEEFEVNRWVNSEDVYDAVCTECGTASRFESAGSRSIAETFEQICYNCSSGRFPELGGKHEFRVINVDPDLDTSLTEPAQPPVYQRNDSD